jgi:small multidrug resistance pump
MSNQLVFCLLVSATVGLNTLAQILLKIGAGKYLLNAYLLGGILVYGISTLMYISVLSKINLSLVYPLVIGLTVIATTIAGTALFHEKIEPIAWLGIGLMLSGIWAIAFGRS